STRGAPARSAGRSRRTPRSASTAWTANDQCASAASTATVGGSTPYWHSWAFGANGLRSEQVRHASTGDTTTTYHYPAAGQARPHSPTGTTTTTGSTTTTASYDYDVAGNTTDSAGDELTWNSENKLARVETPPARRSTCTTPRATS
ncbi:hypothetical protein K7G98_34315, partial [Saccharothrix sp. MB29]|nr:hypothetical protein [Saccharothrix sp. MB29]